jgi:uncharacterized protein (TIGR03083 family)
MNTTAIDVSSTQPLSHEEAMSLQAVELDQTLDLLRLLSEDDWATQTECPDWDIRQMYLHVLGACEAGASMKENMHQMMAAYKHRRAQGGPLEACLSNVQVRDRIDLSPTQLVEELTQIAPTTVEKRTKMPSLMRRMPMKIDGPVFETWKLGYLVDTIYLRDLWMHRVDATQVTDHALVLSADHDGQVVADVVAEWARRHGQPFDLTLTGPAGGSYTVREPGGTPEPIELDAIDFCRMLAGRTEATGLMTTIVPF